MSIKVAQIGIHKAPLFTKEGLGEISVSDQNTKRSSWFPVLEIPLSPPLIKGEAKCAAYLELGDEI